MVTGQKEAEREHEEVERQKAHTVLKQADNTVVSLQTQKADLPPTKVHACQVDYQ